MRLTLCSMAVFALVGALGASSAHAETWALTAGTADWNTAANWSPATVPNGVGATAIFDSTGVTANRVATLSTDTAIGSLTLTNSTARSNTIGVLNGTTPILTFDAAGAGPATITVSGLATGSATPNNIFGAVVLNDDVVVDVTDSNNTSAAGEFTFRGGSLSGAGGVIKNGNGMMTFADLPAKTYTGATVINAGRLRLNATATVTGTSGITVNPGGQFAIEGSVDYTFGSSPDTVITLNGFGLNSNYYPPSPIGNFPGAIRTGTGLTQYIENKINLASDSSINVISTNPVTTPGTLTLVNTISGSGALIANQRIGIISREGFLVVAGNNTYSGGTVVEQGTLRVTSAFSSFANLGTGTVMSDGATLGPGGDASADTFGKLVIDAGVANAIADTAYLNLTGGGTAGLADRGYVELGDAINEVVGGLMLGGVIQSAGTYGATGSGATNINDEFFKAPASGTPGMITVVPVGVPGDYNGNGIVDGADYTLWRNGGPLKNDFTPGVSAADHDFWRSRFGATTNPGSGSGLGTSSAVPEPSTIALGSLVLVLLGAPRRKRLAAM